MCIETPIEIKKLDIHIFILIDRDLSYIYENLKKKFS